jgi:hypothetical protein
MPKLKATIANNKELGGRIVIHPILLFHEANSPELQLFHIVW